MKKLLAVLLVIAMVLTCTACKSKKNNSIKNEFSLGTLNGQSYINNFLGLGCLMPSNWTMLDSEKLQKIPVEDGEVCAMYATASAREVVRIDFRPMSEDQLNSLDLEQFCTDYLTGLNPFIEDAANPVQDSYQSISVTIGREPLNGVSRVASQNDITIYYAAFAIKCDGYVARISINSFVNGRAEQIMSRFYRT